MTISCNNPANQSFSAFSVPSVFSVAYERFDLLRVPFAPSRLFTNWPARTASRYDADVSNRPSQGFVSLVGAGPGDPGLLTVRGRDLLAAADVVVYDALANPLLLKHCRPDAEQVYVGKRAEHHAMSQAAINDLLIDRAKTGRRVVRLKGGDPFVFGRGGEECQALAAAGIAFEVVPGVTAAIAAAAYAGIPVTHRDFNSSVTFITGHERDDGGDSADVDWTAIAKLPCIAFYMGVKSLPSICRKLIDHGLPATTPAATIQWGTTPQQRTVVGTVADLPEKVTATGVGSPAITIVGRVVSLRDTVNWFETRPLFGKTIVVTRSRFTASMLSAQLEALGATVMEAPTIELYTPTDAVAIEQALSATDNAWNWVVFTSPAGVTFTKQKLFELDLDVRAFGSARIAAIGDATAKAIREELGLRVDLSPQRFIAEALADEFQSRGEIAGKKFLLLRADIARPVLRQRLEAAGASEVRDMPIYETRPANALPPEVVNAMDAKQVDWITFTSSSTATHLAAMLGERYRERLADVKIASIGPVTSETLSNLGLEPDVTASHHDIAGLVEAIRSSAKR